jgi:predicted nucleic acid-binding protein
VIFRVLVDTGPLVAILSKRDEYHDRCNEVLKGMAAPLFTCWPVLTEALWLLRSNPAAIQALLKSFDGSRLALLPMDESSLSWIARFMRRYQNVDAQLADASLMYLAEHQDFDTVFTLDRRDFSVYRLRGNRSLRIVPD